MGCSYDMYQYSYYTQYKVFYVQYYIRARTILPAEYHLDGHVTTIETRRITAR